jgi:uncharacterized protein YqgC (DUF456 family)
MWVAAVAYGFAVGFDVIAIAVLVMVTALTAAAVVVGIVLPKRAATASGASTRSQLAAALGAVIGFFVIPIIGVVVGALVGIGIAEYADKRDWPAARASTIAVAKGFGVSTLLQFAIGFMILGLWIVWAGAVIW